MAEGLLLSVSERILGKLGSFASEEIGLWWGVNDEIGSLGRTVSRVKVVLLDAEDRQARGDDPVRDWLGELKEVIYDAEDLVDDFSTEVLRRQVTNEVRLFFSSSNRLAYGLKMGHKIKAIRKRLDAVMSVGKPFNFQQRPVDSSTFVMTKKREQTHSTLPEVVVGREVEKSAIRQLLLSDNYENNVIVISIFGIGGLGKTTLAQLTYNDENVKMHFNLRIWVCVSGDFNLELIVRKILESATGEKVKLSEMNPLKDFLHKIINEKKYLLVLDNVWNENFEKWSSLRDLLVGG
uniref:Disease resistance protein RGA2 n=1 Tax=Rhizophora mucronata TaxID=61149 RepID=A0A2P2MWX9_RHIMU